MSDKIFDDTGKLLDQRLECCLLAATGGAAPRRCRRCKRFPPRADGIPCAACAPGDTSPEAAARRHAERLALAKGATEILIDRIARAGE